MSDRPLPKRSFEDMFTDAINAQEDWLHEHGWVYSSHYPDCVWRWSKTYEWAHMNRGEVIRETQTMITTDPNEAERVERHLMDLMGKGYE